MFTFSTFGVIAAIIIVIVVVAAVGLLILIGHKENYAMAHETGITLSFYVALSLIPVHFFYLSFIKKSLRYLPFVM